MTTKVVIAGDATGALRAINETKTALAGASQQMAASIKPLSAGLSVLQSAFAGIAGLVAGGALFKAAVSATTEWAGQVGSLAKTLGISSEKASSMAVAMAHLGVSSETVVASAARLSNALRNNEKEFTALGVRTRDVTTGDLLPVGEIMAAVNQKLAEQKNVTQQTIDGLKIYGESWTDTKSLLKLTGDEIDRAARRAKELHLVIGPEGIAQTKSYKEQQRDLALVWQSMQVQLGGAVLPTLVKLGAFFNGEGPAAAKTFATAIEAISTAMSAAWVVTRQTGNAIGAVTAAAAMAIQGRFAEAREIMRQLREDNAALGEKLTGMLDAFGKPVAAEKDAATKRKAIAADLQARQAELEHLRAIESGKASAKTVEDDDKATQEKIKNLEILRDALRSAWQASIDESRKAAEQSAAALANAAKIRQSGADSAADIRRGALPAEDQAFLARREAINAADAATIASLEAKVAAQHGRAENAQKLAASAARDAETAAKLADKIADPEERARLVERVAEAQAAAEEARAKIEEARKTDLEATAMDQQKTIADLDAQITALQKKASTIAVQIQIAEATAAIASLQADLNALQDKTITVTVNTVNTESGTASAPPPGDLPSFAPGGYTGPGGKYRPAGIVHAGEHVMPSEIVRQPGMLAFLEALRRRGLAALRRFSDGGLAALQGFADGGLVGRLSLPALSSAAAPVPRAAIFNFPGLGSYPTNLSPYDYARLESDFARAALAKGGRR